MNLNCISIILHILAKTEGLNKYALLNTRSRFKGKLAKAFSQFISFMELAKSGSYTELTTILELAEHFQPKFKKFYKRDPYEVFDFLVWGLHEEYNRSALKKNKTLKDIVIMDEESSKSKSFTSNSYLAYNAPVSIPFLIL